MSVCFARGVIVLLCCVAAVAVAHAGAPADEIGVQSVPAGPKWRVNAYGRSHQTLPKVIPRQGRGFAVAWASRTQDGSGVGVFMRRYDRFGLPMGGEQQVNQTIEGDQIVSGGVALTDGRFAVVWAQMNSDGSSDVFVRFYNRNGSPQGSEQRVTETSRGEAGIVPVVGTTATADGGVIVQSQAFGRRGLRGDVHIRRFGSDGLPASPEMPVNTSPSPHHFAAHRLSGGGYVFVWARAVSVGSTLRYFAMARWFGPDHLPIGDEVQLDEGEIDQRVAAAALPDDTIAIGWSERRGASADGLADVIVRRYDAVGTAVSDRLAVSGERRNQWFTALIATSDGGFAVSWLTTAGGVHVRRYAADATPSNVEAVANLPAVGLNIGFNDGLLPLPAGRVLVVWTENPSGFGGARQIMGRRVNRQGGFIGPAQQWNDTADGVDTWFPPMVQLGGAGLAVAYTQTVPVAEGGTRQRLLVRQVDVRGRVAGPEHHVNDDRDEQTSWSEVRLAALPGGDFVVIWPSTAVGSWDFDVFARKYLRAPSE